MVRAARQVILLGLAAAFCAAAQKEKDLPPLAGMVRTGCDIEEARFVHYPDGKAEDGFEATGWAEYKIAGSDDDSSERRWKRVLARRVDKDRRRAHRAAVADCAAFETAVFEAQLKARK